MRERLIDLTTLNYAPPLPTPRFVDELEESFVIKAAPAVSPWPMSTSSHIPRTIPGELAREDARRIAVNIGGLPALLEAH